MANLSAALNSLASTTVVDFYRARAKHVNDTAALRLARLATVAWGGVLLAIAIAARHSKSVLEAGLTIGSIPMGALLGVFLLGVLTRRPREGAAIAGVAAGLSIVVGIHFYTPIAWTWYVLIGTVTTFGAGLFASLFQGPAPVPLEPAGVRQPTGGLPHLPSQQANPED
jgi:Na+/proline symporter